MTKKLRLLFILSALPFSLLMAQQVLNLGENNYDQNRGIIYDKEVSADFKLHTNGASFGLNFGEIQTYYKTKYWHFELGEIKHPRETKQSRNLQGGIFGGSFRAFNYGKINNFYALRAGYGEKRYISEKARRKGVAVGFTYEVGPSIGILKPYYLVLRYVSEDRGFTDYRSERYSEENEARFLNSNNILGAESFTKGLSEVSLRPGGHAKGAMHFDFGSYDEFIKAIEAGIMVDFYFQDIPIMADSDLLENTNNTPIFLNVFVTLQFGKRS